jgi:hypothetical protein
MSQPIVYRKPLGWRRNLGDPREPLKLKAVENAVTISSRFWSNLVKWPRKAGAMPPAVSVVQRNQPPDLPLLDGRRSVQACVSSIRPDAISDVTAAR